MNDAANDPHPLDALGGEFQAATSLPATAQDAAQAQADQQSEAQAMAIMEAGAVSVVLGLFKVIRFLIDKKLNLPEIRDEWSDDKLEEPAKASIPLLKKHFAKLMEIVGSSPETAVFAMSLLPLCMGLVSAMDKAQERERRERQKGAINANAAAT